MVDPNWILAIVTSIGLMGGLIGVLWRFSRSVDRLTTVTAAIGEAQKAQWKKLDQHTEQLDEHGEKIVRLETWKEFREKEAR